MILTAASAFWAGRRTADIVGAALLVVRNSDTAEEETDDEEGDTSLAVEMFDAVHDLLSGDFELSLTEEGLRP